MKKKFPNLPEWVFDMDEVSASVYEVIGRDLSGHCVSAKGTDLDNILSECIKEAVRISEEREEPK